MNAVKKAQSAELVDSKNKAISVVIEKRANGTRRVKHVCSKVKLTDQSDAAAADINNIMKKYQQTGVLPQVKAGLARYVDNTQLVSLEVAHDMVQNAKALFMELPSQVRKLMDNDPTKLVDFINDKENEDICYKYGILEKVESKQEVSADPPAAASQENASASEA